MKKSIFSIAIAAVGLSAVACNTDIAVDQAQTVNTLTASVENDGTRAVLGTETTGSYAVLFENGDAMDIFGEGTSHSVFTYSGADGVTSATFTTEGSVTGTTLRAILPAQATPSATTLTLPAVQNYAAADATASFAKNAAFMVGTTSGSTVELKHLCGLWEFDLVGEKAGDAVASILFKVNSGNICGDYAIDFVTPALTYSTGGGNSVTLNYATPVALDVTTPTKFFITLPVGTYAGGFEVVATLSNGRVMTKSSTATVNIVRAQVTRSKNAVTYSSFGGGNGTEATPYLINNREQWNNFTLLVNGGNKFAGQYVSLGADIDFGNATIATIGLNSAVNFAGTFNGAGQTLSNANIGSSTLSNQGVFSCVSGTIRNLVLDNITVTSHTAAISRSAVLAGGQSAGSFYNCTVKNSSVSAPSTTTAGYAAGIASHITAATSVISGCTVENTTATSGQDVAAAIVAYIPNGKVVNCISKNNTVKARRYAGGITGSMNGGLVINCQSESDEITVAGSYAGGIAGYLQAGSCVNNLVKGTTIVDTYVSATQFLGLVIGSDKASATTVCKNNVVQSGSINYSASTEPGCIGIIAGRRLTNTTLAHNYYAASLEASADATGNDRTIRSVGYTYQTSTPTILGVNTQGGSVTVNANGTVGSTPLADVLNGNITATYTTATYPDIHVWTTDAETGWPTFVFE